MKTFEEYLKEQIGLDFKQCYRLKVKKEIIKDFIQEWSYDYCIDANTFLDTIQIMEKENIFI